MNNLKRVIEAFYGSEWAIRPDRLQAMIDVLDMRVRGFRLSPEEIAVRIHAFDQELEQENRAARSTRETATAGTGVAVIPLWGIISHRIHQVQNISGPGGTAVEGFLREFRAAANSSDIGSIILDVRSPGGSVEGVPECAAEIFAHRGQGKKITAVSNGEAASAAYWIASAAEEFVVTPSGDVGSIGVYAMHVDESAALEAEGLKITFISAGKYKVDGNGTEPLTDTARQYYQERVDAVYSEFTGAVAKHRGVDVDAVVNGFGEGRVIRAKPAKKLGMVDRVATLDDIIAEHLKPKRNSGAGARASAESKRLELEQARARA